VEWHINNNFLVDSHCHLKYLQEQGFLVDDIVSEADTNGVKILNNVGADINELEYLLDISEQYEHVFCTIGQHPENVNGGIATVEFLLKNSVAKKVIGIGESGLDYHYTDNNKQLQKKNFANHIAACQQLGLPLVIHSRECDDDMIDILQQEMKNSEFRFVLHCFCSTKELAYTGLDLGGFISFSGILTFKNSSELQMLAKEIKLDRLLVETDAPFLAPVPFRGKVNKPSYVKNTAEFLGNLLNKDLNEIQNITTSNFFRLFNKTFPKEITV
jgi:TatD DNase family protein